MLMASIRSVCDRHRNRMIRSDRPRRRGREARYMAVSEYWNRNEGL